MITRKTVWGVLLAAALIGGAACGGDDDSSSPSSGSGAGGATSSSSAEGGDGPAEPVAYTVERIGDIPTGGFGLDYGVVVDGSLFGIANNRNGAEPDPASMQPYTEFLVRVDADGTIKRGPELEMMVLSQLMDTPAGLFVRYVEDSTSSDCEAQLRAVDPETLELGAPVPLGVSCNGSMSMGLIGGTEILAQAQPYGEFVSGSSTPPMLPVEVALVDVATGEVRAVDLGEDTAELQLSGAFVSVDGGVYVLLTELAEQASPTAGAVAEVKRVVVYRIDLTTAEVTAQAELDGRYQVSVVDGQLVAIELGEPNCTTTDSGSTTCEQVPPIGAVALDHDTLDVTPMEAAPALECRSRGSAEVERRWAPEDDGSFTLWSANCEELGSVTLSPIEGAEAAGTATGTNPAWWGETDDGFVVWRAVRGPKESEYGLGPLEALAVDAVRAG